MRRRAIFCLNLARASAALVVFGVLILPLARAAPNPGCPLLFSGAKVAHEIVQERQMLNDFTLNDVSVASTEYLSDRTFKVSLQPGLNYVVRFPSGRTNDIPFEAFAAMLFNAAPNLRTPQIRRLTREQTKSLASAVNYEIPARSIRGVGSVALYYPDMLLGAQYLAQFKSKQDLSDADIPIPPKVLGQLADAWILAQLLAIPDFHVTNWLIANNEVLVIDLALRSIRFRRGLRLGVPASGGEHFQNPLSRQATEDWHQPSRAIVLLRSLVSESMKRFLSSLTEEQIFSIAGHAQFPISALEAQGMLLRAQELLNSLTGT